MTHTLLLIRHAKSDWDVPVGDRDRPLAARGRRQAPAVGRYLLDSGLIPDLAIVSPAARARATWEIVAAHWPREPQARIEESAYTFDGDDLLDIIRATPQSIATLALVGHNPAVEEVVASLTGESVRLPTSALAVIDCPTWVNPRPATLRYAGRPL